MRLSFIVAALAVISGTALRADVLLTIEPVSQSIAAGTATQVQVAISGLGVDQSLGAFDLNFAFDPTIVAFTSLTFGDPVLGDQLDLSGTGSISDFGIQSDGLLEFFEISLDPATLLDGEQADGFVLATLQLQAIGAGTTPLVPSINSVSDSQGAPLDIGIQTGRITVVATPEPGTLGLFFIAGAGIAFRVLGKKWRRVFDSAAG